MDESKAIPVCTLFNQPGEGGETLGDGNFFIDSPSKKSAVSKNIESDDVAESTEVASEPAVCDLFKSVSSSEDLFAGIVRPQPIEAEQNDKIPSVVIHQDQEVLSDNFNDLSKSQVQHELSDIFDNVIADDKTEDLITESLNSPKHTLYDKSDPLMDNTDVMASILINDDSFENISNISFDQSKSESDVAAKEDEAGEETDKKDEILTENNISADDGIAAVVLNQPFMKASPELNTDILPQNNINNSPEEIISTRSEDLSRIESLPTDAEENNQSVTAVLASSLFMSSREPSPFDAVDQTNVPLSPIDAFTNALNTSETDRRRDAWIASETTQSVLVAVAQSQKRIKLEPSHLTRPGLGTSESLGDPVKAVLAKQKGVENAMQRKTLTADSVSFDKRGLTLLIDSGDLRAAVDLCGKILTEHGQGFGCATQESCNTSDGLQWWGARLSLLMHLKLYDLAATELIQFGSFDSADLYYGFYPDLYPGRKGCMVPFSLRLLYADFPRYMNRPNEALGRLYSMLSVCKKILENLNSDKTEDGTNLKLKLEDKGSSLKLWTERLVKVLYFTGNTLSQLREYHSAINIYDEIIKLSPSEDAVPLLSGIGRALLKLGDIKSAQQRFAQVERVAGNNPRYRVQLILNRGFLYLGANNWKEALAQFTDAIKIEPGNLEALNNKAVCHLYLCNLKEAIATQEMAIRLKKETNLVEIKERPKLNQIPLEGALSNLVTLYELESSKSLHKKQALLEHISLNYGDGFNVACLKI